MDMNTTNTDPLPSSDKTSFLKSQDLFQWNQRTLRGRAALDSLHTIPGRMAEPDRLPCHRRHLLLHGTSPAEVHGLQLARRHLPGHRSPRPRPERPRHRSRLHVPRALPRRHRLPHPRGGQPAQAVAGGQLPARRPPRRRQAGIRTGRHAGRAADHVVQQPQRARVRRRRRCAGVRRPHRRHPVGRGA